MLYVGLWTCIAVVLLHPISAVQYNTDHLTDTPDVQLDYCHDMILQLAGILLEATSAHGCLLCFLDK